MHLQPAGARTWGMGTGLFNSLPEMDLWELGTQKRALLSLPSFLPTGYRLREDVPFNWDA